MSTQKNLLVALALILLLGICGRLWFASREAAAIRSVTNIDLSSEANLISYSGQSGRFGAEGVRIWKYALSPSYAIELRGACESIGYSVTPYSALVDRNPFLASHLTAGQITCVRRKRGSFYGISVIQGDTLVVVFLI